MFGLARPLEYITQHTASGQPHGTPLYMAPESAESGQTDQRSDLYSLGCVLYHPATGRPPFQGSHLPELLIALNEEDPIPPGELCPDLPAFL